MTDQNNDNPTDHTTHELWEWASKQDQHLIDEFGIAVVGIGALFFAYGSIHTTSVKLIVAIVGLAASLVLFNDMNESKHEYDAILKHMAKQNTPFVNAVKDIWHNSEFLTKRLEQPTARIMSYFMLLVGWAWAVIIIYRLTYIAIHGPGVTYGIPGEALNWVLTILLSLSGIIPLELLRRLRSGKAKDKKLMALNYPSSLLRTSMKFPPSSHKKRMIVWQIGIPVGIIAIALGLRASVNDTLLGTILGAYLTYVVQQRTESKIHKAQFNSDLIQQILAPLYSDVHTRREAFRRLKEEGEEVPLDVSTIRTVSSNWLYTRLGDTLLRSIEEYTRSMNAVNEVINKPRQIA